MNEMGHWLVGGGTTVVMDENKLFIQRTGLSQLMLFKGLLQHNINDLTINFQSCVEDFR